MRINKSLITYIPTSGSGSGSVTSVALTAPTGFVVSGSPITSSGTLAITFAAGYSLPTTTKQGQWDSAYAFTSAFPSGTAQQLLRVNTLGTALEFFTPSFLTSASINATTPLVWNSGTNTMSIPAANNTTNGYLTSTDWLTFSSKQPAITLTTTGNNGSATLIGATLNIPTYTLTGLGGMSNPFSAALGQIIYSNSAGAPLSLSPNTTTTKKYLVSVGDGVNGAAPYWDTIPASIGGSGTTNRIPRFTASGTIGDSIMAENSGTIDIYGTGRVYTEQAGLGQSNFYVSNKDTTAAITHETRIVTQQLGSGYARTLIHAASYLNNTSRGELGVLTEDGGQYVANIGTIFTNGDNAFSVMSTSAVENIRLNTGGVSWLNGGNVGIGTNNPSYKLDTWLASGTGYQLVGRFLGGTNANGNAGGITLGTTQTQAAYIYGEQIASNGGDLVLGTQNAGAYAERVRIKSAGNVGINNNNPTYTLDVSGTIRAALNTTYQTENGPLMAVSATTPNKRISVGYDNTNDFGFISCLHSGVGWKKLVIQGNGGNVAIGHTAAAEQLDVLGNIKLSGYVTGGSWQGNAVYPAYGGTGATSLTGVVIGNGTSSMTAIAGTSGQLLRRNIANTDYEFFTPNFVSNPMTSLGDMIYSNASGAALRLAANTSTTKKFLAQQGDGTSGDAPYWETINASTIGALSSVGIAVPTGFSVSGSPLTSNGTITIGFASGYALPTTAKQSEWDSAYTNRITNLTTTGNSGAASLISNTLNIPNYTLAGLGGLSNPMTGANGAGDMIYGNAAGAPLRLAPNTSTTKKYLSMTGDGTNGDAPFWDTITGFTGTGTTNYITKFTSSSAIGNSLLYDSGVGISIGNTSPQKLVHIAAANGATVMRMENTDTTVSIGETIGAIEFYGNDTASGVGAIIDANGGGLSGEVNVDIWAGTNGNIVGGITVKHTGAINFTPYTSDPSPASAGDVYYNSSTNKLRCYNGTSWNDLF